MRVLSPVGEFPVRITGVRISKRRPIVESAMGAWRSEIHFEKSDLPYLIAAVAGFAAVFLAGRRSSRNPTGS